MRGTTQPLLPPYQFFPCNFYKRQNYPPKNLFFWLNPYKIEVMITSLIEMLELPIFGHMAILSHVIKFGW